MAKKYPKLGENLRRLLFERKKKPADLSRALDIPSPTIHRLITGKSMRPYRSSLEPIANYFSITVNQLLGEEPLNDQYIEKPNIHLNNSNTSIPIYQWSSLPNLEQATPIQNIIANNASSKAFALVMPDTSMDPIFPINSILIFDPEIKARDRSYVLVFIQENKHFVFRQILIDVDHMYLKPLNPDLSAFKMRLLHNGDMIIASLIESRIDHRLSELIVPPETNALNQ